MSHTDSCDWCGRGTNNIQIQPGSPSLCPTCCPDIDEKEIPDDIPPQWHFMDEEERDAWLNGMTMTEIKKEFDWHTPPENIIKAEPPVCETCDDDINQPQSYVDEDGNRHHTKCAEKKGLI